MKILLLTDIPPCTNYSGGLALARICRLLPPEALVLFVVLNPALRPEIPPDLSGLEMAVVDKPREHGRRFRAFPGPHLSWLQWLDKRAWLRVCREQAKAAADFGRRHGVDRVMAVLEGQTLVTQSVMVAEDLSVPLHSLVWDPLQWWLTTHDVNLLIARFSLNQFDQALRRSQVCGAASEAMADRFSERYGTRSVPIFGGFPVTRPVIPDPRPRDELRIGVAGQFYAADAWHELLGALRRRRWTLAGRAVRVDVLGVARPPGIADTDPIAVHGWQPEVASIELLREVDLLYCPYPFGSDMAEVARLSFPSKLSFYLGVGRPVLFHGPAYSSPFRYLEAKDAALCCTEPDGDSALATVEAAFARSGAIAGVMQRARAAFLADHTEDALKRRLDDFLELAPPAAGTPPSPMTGPGGACAS
ncbi:MAG TPA: hypothetical protein VFO41_00160 [Alphaproteobacteria bacterium]|nr:hypothetical protein [Alphaproteobacteria bacterium]